MTTRAEHPGAVLGVARFYHDPRASIRGLLDSAPSEARLLSYVMMATGLLLMRQIVRIMTNPALRDNQIELIMQQVVSMMFLLPLIYYLLAAMGTLIARMFGGQGGWRDGRCAFFWAALVSAPVLVICGLLPMVLASAPAVVTVGIAQFGAVFFAWALAQCFAEAFGFTRTWLVLAVISSPFLLLVGVVMLSRL